MPASPLHIVGLPEPVANVIQRYLDDFFGETWRESTKRLCLSATEQQVAEECDHVITLGTSADAALPSPFSLDVLARHIAPLLADDAQTIWPLWNEWVLDSHARTLKCEPLKETIELTDKEALLLEKLMHTAPQSADKTALLEAVWGYGDAVDTKTLETHVYRLRQKLEPLLPNPDKGIQTEVDGYRWQP